MLSCLILLYFFSLFSIVCLFYCIINNVQSVYEYLFCCGTALFSIEKKRGKKQRQQTKTNTNEQTNKKVTKKKKNTRGKTPPHKVASEFSASFVQLIDFRAVVSLWAQDVVSFAWGLTSSLRARSLWHQHVVLSQHIPLCSQKPHSSDSGAPEKSWKGHLAMEVKGMSFRDSQTCLYSLLSQSSLKDRYCP